MSFFDRFREDDEDAWVRSIASELNTEPDRESVESRIRDLSRAIDALVAAADLRTSIDDPPAPDAGSVEKAKALAAAVRADDIVIGPEDDGGRPDRMDGRDSANEPSDLVAAARQVRTDRSPSSERARELLSFAARPHDVDPEETYDVLASVVGELDERSIVLRAAGDIDPKVPGEAASAHRALGSADGKLVGVVRQLLISLESQQEGSERTDPVLDRFENVVDSLCDRIEANSDVTLTADGPIERLERLLAAIEQNDLTVETDSDDLTAIAVDIRREVDPDSRLATRLLDKLAAGQGIANPLAETVEVLDSTATNRSIAGDVETDHIRSLAQDLVADLRNHDHPSSTILNDRVDELETMVLHADESNTVVPYAAVHELRFYNETLIDALPEATSVGTSKSAISSDETQPWLTNIADRREAIASQHVEAKDDHNHVFPRHFLSLADELISQAERLESRGEHAKTAGVLEALDKLLDGIETLYERNEYSVMLRRLRG